MSAKVILTVITGSLKGQRFEFSDHTTCIVGRAKDCHLRLPNDEHHKTISRYHCLLDINPPDIRIRDFGSLHGTYVNGQIIGKRQRHQTPEEGAQIDFPEYDLKEGDEIKLRHTVFRVSIQGARTVEVTPSVSRRKRSEPTESWQDAPTVLQVQTKVHTVTPTLPAIRDYTILKQLGKGSLGEVYLAQHNQTGELAAIKAISSVLCNHAETSRTRSPRGADQQAIEQFIQDVENTKTLQHLNVVQFKECSYDEGNFFLVTEYCNGGSVLDLMGQRGGQLSVNEAMSITLQSLDGLAYAHNAEIANGYRVKTRGLVHRNLTPGNIFLANVGLGRIAKIANYGLAKVFDLAGLSSLSLSGTQADTLAFMPRQQVLNFKDARPEADIWAIAACLYYMLTGEFPRNFAGQDPFLVALQTKVVPIRERDVLIPKRLAEVIDLALLEEPAIHFKNASAFKRALESVM